MLRVKSMVGGMVGGGDYPPYLSSFPPYLSFLHPAIFAILPAIFLEGKVAMERDKLRQETRQEAK